MRYVAMLSLNMAHVPHSNQRKKNQPGDDSLGGFALEKAR